MAYTDFGAKIILHRYGAVKIVMAEDGACGDLITADGYVADAEDSKPAVYVLCEDADSGDEAWCALAVEIKKPATGTGPPNTWARGDHSGTLGTALYLDGGADQGEACESAGTIAQIVGYVTSQDTAFLCPMNYLTGTNLSLSGTLAVTGVATFTGKPVFNGGGTITAGQFFAGAPVKMTITEKGAGATLTVAEAGIIVATADGITLVLPAVSGNAGLRYIIKVEDTHSDGVVVDGDGAETIDGAATKTSPAQYSVLDIVCDGDEWHVINTIGSWT